MAAGDAIGLGLGVVSFLAAQGWLIAKVIANRFASQRADLMREIGFVSDAHRELARKTETAFKASGVDHTALATQVAVMQASLPTFERMETLVDRAVKSMHERVDDRMHGVERRIDSMNALLLRGEGRRRLHQDDD